MTTSKRLAEKKVAKFEKSIVRRGSVTSWKKKLTAENIVILLFAFLIVGSFLFQMIKLAITAE